MRQSTTTAGTGDVPDSDLILVMDDDEFVRELVRSMLQHLGYTVMTCINGEEAIERYKRAMEAGWPFYAAILDLVIIDGMGGAEAARRIRGIDPGARLIVSSGYSAEPVMDYPAAYGFSACLPKPYGVAELGKVLELLRS